MDCIMLIPLFSLCFIMQCMLEAFKKGYEGQIKTVKKRGIVPSVVVSTFFKLGYILAFACSVVWGYYS